MNCYNSANSSEKCKNKKPKKICCENDFDKQAVDSQNIKSVLRMNEFLKRLFYSYNSIIESLTLFLDQLYYIYNELNFQSVDIQIIDSYNKIIMFLFDTLIGILTDTISGSDYMEILIIKPIDVNYYTHKINLTYFVDNSTSLSRCLGIVSNVSIKNINNLIILNRGELEYSYAKIDLNSSISVTDFRFHIDTYINQTNILIGFFYKDVDSVKEKQYE